MAEFLKNIPEFMESELGESIASRTESLTNFKELGPPNLVHLIKYQPKSENKNISTYHYVSGVDASSSASIAAYLNDLTYSMAKDQAWFGKNQSWEIHTGLFCIYNAFSRIDIRVEMKIPGGIESIAIDEYGNRKNITSEMWTETFLCEILRWLQFSDDYTYQLPGFRKLNPITSIELEEKFLDACSQLFLKGWKLGSSPEIHIPDIINNNLTNGILKYLNMTGRYAVGINLFEKLRVKNPEIIPFLAKLYFLMDEEFIAIDLLNESLKLNPVNYSSLIIQVEYLIKKNCYNLALQCAKKAVNSAPSEFITWESLAQVYIALEDYRMALLTLNSCPIFSYYEKDGHRMPEPIKAHFPSPIKMDDCELTLNEIYRNNNTIDPTLLRLPSLSLRGTFLRAYDLLIEMVTKIGWNQLLKLRSSVFIMKEYKLHKKNNSTSTQHTSISALSDYENNDTEASKTEDSKFDDISGDYKESLDTKTEILTQKKKLSNTINEERSSKNKKNNDFILYEKRLCERWLDNLFMILYEDLRVYTIWRAEALHFKSQKLIYKKTAPEWEILGNLAWKLQYKEESLEAFRNCLELNFSVKAWDKNLLFYEEQEDYEKVLLAIAKLNAWNCRWYSEFSPDLLRHLRNMIAYNGITKIRNMLSSITINKTYIELMDRYLIFIEKFKLLGYSE
ncbi:hypothetical protein T552_03071 [Pneumocystis carinii B80]|uniref:Uncharacterized protein n=1 Tax=Pneumocystis carinii (strain B80) TaxID=1408658 RepID=A0A0W4ZCN7_PNEC8|nr:hypothetical protein T552_03071 [Pneumocystis carinii B80]KTW26180.1 hypothetical protein T552_03071 [Pneumocystis carinii B80]